MDLNLLRQEIDAIDDKLVALFVQRMQIAAQIGSYKKEQGLPVFVPEREQQKLAAVAEKAGSEMADYTKALYVLLMELSRAYQIKLTEESTEVAQ